MHVSVNNMEEEVTKEKFKELYLKYGAPNGGWTEEYWNQFYEEEQNKKYFVSAPVNPESTRMFIVSDDMKHRMIFMTEEVEESFFDFPGDQ